MNRYYWLSIILSLFIFVSCKQDLSPEGSLRSYVNYAMSDSASKDGFIERSTGDLRASLETMDEDEFKKFSKDMGHAKREKISINNSNCEELSCFITYTLRYESEEDGKTTYDIEVRKIAELIKEDDQWKLAGIENVKSYYEGSSELTEDDLAQQNQALEEE